MVGRSAGDHRPNSIPQLGRARKLPRNHLPPDLMMGSRDQSDRTLGTSLIGTGTAWAVPGQGRSRDDDTCRDADRTLVLKQPIPPKLVASSRVVQDTAPSDRGQPDQGQAVVSVISVDKVTLELSPRLGVKRPQTDADVSSRGQPDLDPSAREFGRSSRGTFPFDFPFRISSCGQPDLNMSARKSGRSSRGTLSFNFPFRDDCSTSPVSARRLHLSARLR